MNRQISSSNDTIWSKTIKETFVTGNANEEYDDSLEGFQEGLGLVNKTVPETDDALHETSSFNERILSGGATTTKMATAIDVSGNDHPDPTTSQTVQTAIANSNPALLISAGRTGMKHVKTMASQSVQVLSAKVAENYDLNEAEKQIAQDAISSQVAMYLTIPATYWIVLNWWHTWNYTNTTIDFSGWLKLPLISSLIYIVEAPFMVIETFNYYILSRRMDASLPAAEREKMRMLWEWRPITFTIFYLLMLSVTAGTSAFGVILGALDGSSSLVSTLIFAFSVIGFFYYNMNIARFKDYLTIGGIPLVAIFIMLLCFIGMMIFAGLGGIMFSMYILYFSHFSLLWNTKLNLFSKIAQMFNDLRDAPLNNPNPEDTWTKLTNFGFRNFHGLFLLGMFSITLIVNITTTLAKIKDQDLMSAVIAVNLVLFGLFVLLPFGYNLMKEFFAIIINLNDKRVNPEDFKPVSVPAVLSPTPSLSTPSATSPSSNL